MFGGFAVPAGSCDDDGPGTDDAGDEDFEWLLHDPATSAIAMTTTPPIPRRHRPVLHEIPVTITTLRSA
ncbi:MAG: hypothetical protein QOF59_2499 [Actinomycetota bacterium]|nr:hypothetical protein [Actinomycetota bacterium]